MALDWDVPPYWAINILRHLEARTGSATNALAEVGLPDSLLHPSPGRIRIRDELALLEAAARQVDDEIFACDAGLGFDPRATSLLSYLLLNGRTLSEGVALAQRYLRVERQRAVLASRTEGDTVFLHVDIRVTDVREHPLFIEHALGAILSVVRCAVGRDLRPLEVHLVHPRQQPFRSRLARRFGGAVHSELANPGLLFDRRVLDLPLVDPDSVLLSYLTAHAQHLLDTQKDRHGDIAQKVRTEIAAKLMGRAPTKTEIATTVGMSPRTLSRRLAIEGSSYESLLLALRRDLAEQYLADPALGLAQIAHLLGYADQPSFATAYKRWTGKTPGAARKCFNRGNNPKTSDTL